MDWSTILSILGIVLTIIFGIPSIISYHKNREDKSQNIQSVTSDTSPSLDSEAGTLVYSRIISDENNKLWKESRRQLTIWLDRPKRDQPEFSELHDAFWPRDKKIYKISANRLELQKYCRDPSLDITITNGLNKDCIATGIGFNLLRGLYQPFWERPTLGRSLIEEIEFIESLGYIIITIPNDIKPQHIADYEPENYSRQYISEYNQELKTHFKDPIRIPPKKSMRLICLIKNTYKMQENEILAQMIIYNDYAPLISEYINFSVNLD